jgi:hypothetical protein
MLVFTKWGGFDRRTLVIDRRDPFTDEQNTPLVEYDCGMAFWTQTGRRAVSGAQPISAAPIAR